MKIETQEEQLVKVSMENIETINKYIAELEQDKAYSCLSDPEGIITYLVGVRTIHEQAIREVEE